MGSTTSQTDRAFAETSDPSAYVSRDATERALSALDGWIAADASGPTLAALIGPPGLGKTFLLRLLESRLGERSRDAADARRVLYLPYAGLLPTDLCEWVHGLLGRTVPRKPEAVATSGGEPETESERESRATAAAVAALLGLAGEGAKPFFLLLDDADSMPPETSRALLEGLPREASPLRILMALTPDAKSSRLLAAFDAFAPEEIHLEEPMTEEETAAYVRARLDWAGHSAAERDGIETSALRRIHALSGGVPQQVHRVAESVFGPESASRPSDLDTKRRREDWLGSPIEDDL